MGSAKTHMGGVGHAGESYPRRHTSTGKPTHKTQALITLPTIDKTDKTPRLWYLALASFLVNDGVFIGSVGFVDCRRG